MAVMSQDPEPGERRLDRPPSDRYVAPEVDRAAAPAPGSVGRAARVRRRARPLVGAVLTVLLGGVLALSAGLLVVWARPATSSAWRTKLGGGTAARGRQAEPVAGGRRWPSSASPSASSGLWWYAGTEGGVLPLVDYLGQTFGLLVPLQALLAAGFAWWGAR